jgi:hypothetical protein
MQWERYAKPNMVANPRIVTQHLHGLAVGEQLVLSAPGGDQLDVFFGTGDAAWVGHNVEIRAHVGGVYASPMGWSRIKLNGGHHIGRWGGIQAERWDVILHNDGAAVLSDAQIVAVVDTCGVSTHLIDPARGAFEITPSDIGVHEFKCFYVGVGGNVRVSCKGRGDQIDLLNVPAGTTVPLQITRLWATATTATNIVGFDY